MTRRTSSYRNALLEALADPAEAEAYLNAAIEDSPESFLKALGNVAQARQITKVAKEAGIQRETLHRSFSSQGNPTFSTLSSVLRAVGFKLSIGVAHPPVRSIRLVPSTASASPSRLHAVSTRGAHPLLSENARTEDGGYDSLGGQGEGDSWGGGGLGYASCGGR